MSTHSLTARGSDRGLPFQTRATTKAWLLLRMSRILLAAKTDVDSTRTIHCRQLFAGHVVSSRPIKRKEKIHRMISSYDVNHHFVWMVNCGML